MSFSSLIARVEGDTALVIKALPIVKGAVLAVETPNVAGPQKAEAAAGIALAGIQSLEPDIVSALGENKVTAFIEKWIPTFVNLFNLAGEFIHSAPGATK